MEWDPVEVVRKAMEAFNREFGEGMDSPSADTRELFAEEPTIVPIRAAIEHVTYTGAGALDEFMAAMRASWRELSFDPLELREVAPGKVFGYNRIHAVGIESGARIDAPIPFLVEVERGRITLLRSSVSESEAVEAGG